MVNRRTYFLTNAAITPTAATTIIATTTTRKGCTIQYRHLGF